MHFSVKILSIFLVPFVLSICACSGGGGGSESNDTSGRTTKTGLRIVHTAIDAVPIGAFQDGVYVLKSSYMDSVDYQPVAVLPSILRVTRGSRPNDVIRELSFIPAPDTEYTLLVLGQAQDNQIDLELVSEPIVRPLKGLGRVRFLNALVGANSATCNLSDGITNNSLKSSYGVISDPIEIPPGIKDIVAVPSTGAQRTQTLELIDRGEWLIVLAGKNELGFSILNVISDFD